MWLIFFTTVVPNSLILPLEKEHYTYILSFIFTSEKALAREKKIYLKGKSWIHTQELQDYFGVLLVPCNTSKSHKYLMEKQQKMRSAAVFWDRIYVAEHFFFWGWV
jgi:hypothetical protein